MKKDVLDLLLCPSCHNPTLNISNISYENKNEIRTGEVRCTFCAGIFEILKLLEKKMQKISF